MTEIVKIDIICKGAKVRVRKNDKGEIIEIIDVIDMGEI